MSQKSIKIILQTLLLSVIAIVPFLKTRSLYFPFISGKVYVFRLLIWLAFFFWIWLIFKEKTINKKFFIPYKNIFVISLLLFVLAQCLVSFLGVSPALSFFSTLERQDGVIQYGFWVLYFLMLVYAFRDKKDWTIFFSVFIIAAFLISSHAWFNFKGQDDRLFGLFGNPSYLAAYLLFAIGFCIIAIERKFFNFKFAISKILLYFMPLFFAVTLFFTQTRGVYLGLGAAIVLFCFLSILFLRKQNKKLAVLCAVILAVGLVSVAGLFFAKDTSFVKNNYSLSRITEVTNFWELGSIRERLLNWEIALKAFKEKPIFGYGPENFSVASNKYYDYRIGRGDPWFDHAHNQLLEPLATGGIVLFSFFIFLLASVFYIIFKISRKEKILSFLLGSIFLAYIVQDFFLFDTLPIYLGLFPFFAFVVWQYAEYSKEQGVKDAQAENKSDPVKYKFQKSIIVAVAFFSIWGIYETVFLPYQANAATLNFLAYSSSGYYKESKQFAQKAFSINSPYTYWEIRKRIGWQLMNILDFEGAKKFNGQEAKDVADLYDFIVPEMEKLSQSRPFDAQMYYVLPRTYRLAYKNLGKNDLEKARLLLEKSFTYSSTRVEYYSEMSQVLLAQGKFKDGEALLKNYVSRIQSFPYFPYLFMGHYYYVAEKYDLAMENYTKAREAGYDFNDNDGEYSRYIDAAQQTKKYQEIVDMSLKHIEKKGPSADMYFNTALGYYYLGEKSKAKEFFIKALELNKDAYQKYEHFFN